MPAYHTHAAILSTGDEVVLGQIQDRNAGWLAQQLVNLGIMPVQHAAVPDDLNVLASTIRRLAEAAPLLIMSGGLGPTDGDLTRAALAQVLNCEQVTDEHATQWLTDMLAKRGRQMTGRQARQTQRPALATCLPNAFGTAPGLHAQIPVAAPHTICDIFCLPGPPGEMHPMVQDQVLPQLRTDPSTTIRTRLLHIIGVAEADAVTRLGTMTKRDRADAGDKPLVGITASGGILTLRIRYEGRRAPSQADALIDADEAEARRILGIHVIARDEQTLAAAALAELAATRSTLAVAESCTGGMLSALLTDVPGSSANFLGGWITYGNEAKVRDLGVSTKVITKHGAVSREVASALATGALHRSGATHALAITGIAGPNGGTPDKPVGTVWIALARSTNVDTRCFLIPGNREDVRGRAARTALAMLLFALRGQPAGEPGLLWQTKN